MNSSRAPGAPPPREGPAKTTSYLDSTTSALLSRFAGRLATDEAVILDVGSAYWKVGLAGEWAPRAILPVTLPVANWNSDSWATDGKTLGRQASEFLAPTDGLSAEKLHSLEWALVDLLNHTYDQYLLHGPAPRKLLILEPPLLPVPLKRLLAGIAYRVLQVPALSFAPSPGLAFLTTGKPTGMVIDFGHSASTIVPIVDHNVLLPLVGVNGACGKALTAVLQAGLVEAAQVHVEYVQDATAKKTKAPFHSAWVDCLPLELWEDIKTRLLWTGPAPADGAAPASPNVLYPLPGPVVDAMVDACAPQRLPDLCPAGCTPARVHLEIPSEARRRLMDEFWALDEDGQTLPRSVLDCLLKLPIDVRSPVSGNILCVGGGFMIPGVKGRLLRDIKSALRTVDKYACLQGLAGRLALLKTPWRENEVAWAGASLAATAKLVPLNANDVTRADWEATAPAVPDWMDLQPHEPPPLR